MTRVSVYHLINYQDPFGVLQFIPVERYWLLEAMITRLKYGVRVFLIPKASRSYKCRVLRPETSEQKVSLYSSRSSRLCPNCSVPPRDAMDCKLYVVSFCTTYRNNM